MRFRCIAMRNKLKETKKNQNANDRPPLAVGPYLTLVLSDHGDSNGPHGAGDTLFTAPSRLGRKMTGCPENTKLAPVFSRRMPKGKSKESGDEELHHPVEKLSIVLPPSEQQLSTSTVSQTERKESWREQLSSSALHSCLKDIQESNAAFPVQRLFGVLQTKARKALQDGGSTDNHFHSRNPERHSNNKRQEESDSCQNASKRLRPSLTPESTKGSNSLPPENVRTPVLPERTHPRVSRLNRVHRLKRKAAANPNVANHTTPDSPQRESSSSEDVLWTDKYTPQCIGEVIGNGASVQTLHSWLEKWKRRADSDERRTTQGRKAEADSSDAWDCGDFQGEDGSGDEGGELLRNAVLLTGPTGVGKTASVYACAQELGFQVFEVNCSTRRDGRRVLHQLKEATQSHLVETSGKDPLKPAYFNNYSTGGFTPRHEHVLGRSAAPKSVSSHPKTLSTQTCVRLRRKGKTNPTSVTLANFFKTKAKAGHLHGDVVDANRSSESKQTATRKRKAATSLILFEEVDVVFEEDVGFHAAIKTFMTSTKRPVVLTANDPLFRERFGCSLEEIVFTTPSTADVCSYLQLVCLAESVNLELDDGTELVTLARGDVRRCLLQLQFWVNGSGRLPKEPSHSGADSKHRSDSKIQGLHPATPNELLTLFKSWTEPEVKKLLSLLAESWRRDVPLLYSNLELLLHIWTEGTAAHSPRATSSQSEMAASDATAINVNAVRNAHILSRGGNTACSYLTTPPPRGALTDPGTAEVAADCLDALADVFDLMSYVDAAVPAARPLVSGPCGRDGFVWTGAELKDSSLDEVREEEEEGEGGRGQSWERLLEIQAAVEGLGFHSCLGQVSETWSAAHKQDVGDPRRHGKCLSFSRQPLCSPSVSQRGYKLSRTMLSSLPFGLLGNRRAVGVDYTPILRCIVRSQRAQKRDEADRRVNYLSSRQLGLSKSTVQLLAAGFSKSGRKKSC